MMGNNLPLTAAIKKEMGDDTTVKTKCGMPFTVSAEVDGKTGNRECLPMYLSAAHAAYRAWFASRPLRRLPRTSLPWREVRLTTQKWSAKHAVTLCPR